MRFLRLESEKGKREETKTKERKPLTSDITGCLYWNWWDYCCSCSTAKIPTIHSHLVGNKIEIHIPRDSRGISKSLKSEKNECQNIRMNKFKLFKLQNPERLLYFSYRFFFPLKKSLFSQVLYFHCSVNLEWKIQIFEDIWVFQLFHRNSGTLVQPERITQKVTIS